jgi:hypothetical protein
MCRDKGRVGWQARESVSVRQARRRTEAALVRLPAAEPEPLQLSIGETPARVDAGGE